MDARPQLRSTWADPHAKGSKGLTALAAARNEKFRNLLISRG